MREYSISLTCLAILLAACDGPYKNCPEHYFSEEFKSYTFFNDGSYWVYQDTLNNKLDSIYLLSQEIKYKEDCDYTGEPEEFLTQSFYSSFFVPNEFNIDCRAADRVYLGYDFSGYFRDDLIVGESNNFTYEEKIDSLLINETWYKDVMVFTKFNLYKYYWARRVGLVKKVFPDPNNSGTIYDFEIVRYKIN
jgi:hypothetical protein